MPNLDAEMIKAVVASTMRFRRRGSNHSRLIDSKVHPIHAMHPRVRLMHLRVHSLSPWAGRPDRGFWLKPAWVKWMHPEVDGVGLWVDGVDLWVECLHLRAESANSRVGGIIPWVLSATLEVWRGEPVG